MTSRATMLCKIAGPKSIRLGATDFFNMGRNFQNITKDQRRFVVFGKGRKGASTDQSGADQKIIAYESPPGKLRKLFENGIKPATYITAYTSGQFLLENYEGNPNDFETLKSIPIEDLKNIGFWPGMHKLIRSTDDWPPNKRWYFINKKLGHSFN